MRVLVNALPLVNVTTGIARYLRCLYSELERMYGSEVEFWYFDGQKATRRMPPPPKADTIRQALLPQMFWHLPVCLALPIRMAFQIVRERRFFKALKGMDLYHEAAFFPFRVSPNVPVVMTVHDMSLLVCPENHPAERVAHFKRYFFRRLSSVSQVITVSDFTAAEMARLKVKTSLPPTTTLLACDSNRFYPRSVEAVTVVRKRLQVPSRYFLFVGSGDQRKNLDIVPKAMSLLPNCDAQLVVAGWKGWSDKLSSPNIVQLGYVDDDDLAHLYSGALGVIFCSSYEGFGLPVLEAMSCGGVVVTSNLASMPEVGGDAVLYVNNPRDPNELAVHLESLLENENLRHDLISKGLKRAKKFSWERCAKETFAVFTQCLKHCHEGDHGESSHFEGV